MRDLQTHAARRRRRARRLGAAPPRSSRNVYLLRRQPDRRRLVQAGPAAGHRLFTTNPGPSGRQLFAQHYGFTVTPGQPGRHRLRARRRARHGDCRAIPATPPTGARRADRDADHAVPRQGPGRPERDLRGLGRRQRHLHAARQRLQAGHDHAGAGCRRTSALAAAQLVAQVARLNAAGAQYIVVVEPARHRQDAGRHRRRARRPQITAIVADSSTRR